MRRSLGAERSPDRPDSLDRRFKCRGCHVRPPVLPCATRSRPGSQGSRSTGMAEDAAFALNKCMRRHISIGCASVEHVRARPEPAGHARRTAGRRQRRACGRRLRLSPSAMSRALARLRKTTGDPLLVRAGRGLVPTPRALELRERVSQLVQDSSRAAAPSRRSISGISTGPSRYGPAMASWRISGRVSSPASRGSPGRPTALRAEAGQGQRAAARRCGRSGNRRHRRDDRARKFARERCSGIVTSASCGWGTR